MTDINLSILIFVSSTVCAFALIFAVTHYWQLYQSRFKTNADENLQKMFMFVDANRIFAANIGFIIFAPPIVYFFSGNIFYAVLVFLVILATPRVTIKLMESRRRSKIVSALPDALAQIAGNLTSGATFTSAIEHMVSETNGPISQEFGLLLKEQKIGISPQDALANLAERVDLEEIDLVVTATLISRDVGGNLAETFLRLSHMLRRKIEMEGKIKALTSQGKLQGWVVAALPFGIIAALTVVEPQGIEPIFSTILGWGFLTVIIILELMGALMIRKIVSIDI
ncbi:MAG: secretion system protein F [Proteobacteria bacterium]|nr:MAG: secretion system protein F [Pseudomonadota bacterium]